MTYILQSENFFERFYPEVKVKLERIEMDKDKKEKKMCNVKILWERESIFVSIRGLFVFIPQGNTFKKLNGK